MKPNASLPRISCDFNACGWSGAPDDDCYYAFDKQAVTALCPVDGMRVFIYDDNGDGSIIGCEARLERFLDGWRIRPDKSSWFEGRLDETQAA
jgi:hypothetical protein